MKATIRSLLCLAIVLSTLGVAGPAARADDTSDYVAQIYRDQQQLNDYLNSIQQTQDYVNQIYRDQQQLNDYLNSIQQSQQQLNDYLNSISQNN